MTEIFEDDDLDLNNNLYYFNALISRNIDLLTQYSIGQYSSIYTENLELKNKNEMLKDDVTYYKKRKLDLELDITKLERQIEKDDKHKKPKITKTDFEIIKYRKNKDTYDENQVKRTLNNIRSIKDIINLKDKWRNIRHHTQLQKLYHLIKPLKKLDSMIGMEDVKNEVMKKIIYYLQNPFNDEYLHTIISGPPGVGKTEVAKIYAEIFQHLGILKNNSFIEVKRDQLVGEYLGQTAPKTKKVLESAMGGVIFIDEAYSLGNSEKRDSFSKECIDMINQYLSEYKNDFMMIVAGYDDELNKCFFAYNPGLKRRFSTYFNIDEYSPEELKKIFYLKLRKFNYENKIDEMKLVDFFKTNHKDFKHFGGDIEKLVNELKYVHANRSFYEDKKDNRDITFIDLKNAYKNFIKNSNKKEEEYKPPMGMYI